MKYPIPALIRPIMMAIFVALLIGLPFSFVQADCKDFCDCVETVPLDLVSPRRADLMAKYIYARHRDWKSSCRFGHEIYHRHLLVWNAFWEHDPPKRCFEDFRDAFDRLLDSIRQEGFNASFPVPLGLNGAICNGAHRTTACLLYGKNLVVEKIPYECSYGFDYFKSRGLESHYLDAMALQYCELKSNSYVMVVFPSAEGHEKEIEQIINTYAEIVYKKEILFTANGGFNFILTAYENEPFVLEGATNNYPSARHKARLCFPEALTQRNPARVYLLECKQLDLIKACKNKIRALFHISNDSVHSTDTHAEAIVLARALFNKNSIHCLNHKKDASFPLFDHYFAQYRKWLASQKKENEWFCVDSGAVLAAYGLRECSDLDFLHYEKEIAGIDVVGIDSHNCHLHYHAIPLDDILFDPDHYFFYKGIKFCSLAVLKKMKERRGEAKDFDDIRLMNQL